VHSVDQIVGKQGLDKISTAPNPQIRAVLFLEFLYLLDYVAGDEK
jgi:hypothetical protein